MKFSIFHNLIPEWSTERICYLAIISIALARALIKINPPAVLARSPRDLVIINIIIPLNIDWCAEAGSIFHYRWKKSYSNCLWLDRNQPCDAYGVFLGRTLILIDWLWRVSNKLIWKCLIIILIRNWINYLVQTDFLIDSLEEKSKIVEDLMSFTHNIEKFFLECRELEQCVIFYDI